MTYPKNMTKSYTINVLGYIWQGSKATATKSFKEIPENVKGEFGDFESLIDYEIIEETLEIKTEANKTITILTKERIKDWENEDNLNLYQDTCY